MAWRACHSLPGIPHGDYRETAARRRDAEDVDDRKGKTTEMDVRCSELVSKEPTTTSDGRQGSSGEAVDCVRSIHLNRWSQVETRLFCLSACLPVCLCAFHSVTPSQRLVPMLVARPHHPQRAAPAVSSRISRLALQSYRRRAPACTRPDMGLNRRHSALPRDPLHAGSGNLEHPLLRELVTRRCRSSRLW